MLEKDVCSLILEEKHHWDPGVEVLEMWLRIFEMLHTKN